MFAELCATGRTIELDTIHRFRNDWEAAASLQLRHGDPAGLDAYLTTAGSSPAPFDEHLDNIAHRLGRRPPTRRAPRDHHHHATTTSTPSTEPSNTPASSAGQLGHHHLDVDHRRPASRARRRRDHHPPQRPTPAHHDRGAGPQPRLLDRHRHHPDGALTVTRIDGHGTITLPHDYVAEHVQLGYAATEPGNQSDTTTRSITLATPATTCRGLYVADHPRPRREPHLRRHRHPRRRRRHRHPRTHPHHRPRRPPRHPHPTRTRRRHPTHGRTSRPRCQIPDWFHDLHHTARSRRSPTPTPLVDELDRQADSLRRGSTSSPDNSPRSHPAAHHTTAPSPPCDRTRPAASNDTATPRRELANSGPLHRRTARHTLAAAGDDVTTARTALDELTRRAQPLLDQRGTSTPNTTDSTTSSPTSCPLTREP